MTKKQIIFLANELGLSYVLAVKLADKLEQDNILSDLKDKDARGGIQSVLNSLCSKQTTGG